MTVIARGVRHWLLIYKDGEEIRRWATSEKTLRNMMEKRGFRTKEAALRNLFRPRFFLGEYACTSNQRSDKHLFNSDMLTEVFVSRIAESGDGMEYRYLIL